VITHLSLGWLALTFIGAPTAAVLFIAGRWAWTRITVARHARRLIRDVQLYVHRPLLRPLFDTHDQPRKETP
jgi:hypothetical protein